jgi:uncharacterized coiled-coil protein SlyX
MENQVVKLEEKCAHLEHTIEALNAVVTAQAQKMETLQDMMQHLALQVRQLNDKQAGGEQTLDDERPPHY